MPLSFSNYATAPVTARALGLGMAILLGGYLLLTSTVTLHETLWKYDVKRILQLCLFGLIFATVLFNTTLREAFQAQLSRMPRWLAIVLFLLLGLGILSSAYNASSTMSLLYSLAEVALLTLLVLAVLAVAACREVAGTVFDQAAVLLLAMVGLAVGLQELLGVLAALLSGLEFHPRIALLHFSWPRFYNQVQSWSIPVIAALPLVFPGKPLAKLLCITALALEWYVVIATGGRGSMIAVSIALLAAVIFLPAIRKTLIQYQFAGLLVAVLIYGLVVVGHQNLTNQNLDETVAVKHPVPSKQTNRQPQDKDAAIQSLGDSSGKFLEPVTGSRVWTSSGRTAMWRDSWHDAQNHPYLGIGPMGYACKGPINRAGHPHNFPLQFLGEWGFPAFLLMSIIAGILFLKLAKTIRKPEEASAQNIPLASFLATGVLAALVHACLSGVLVMPASQVTGVLVLGCLLGLLPSGLSRRPANISAFITLTLALMLSLAFLAFGRHEIAEAETRWEQTPRMDRGIPRLWQNGKVCRLYQENGNPNSER